MDSVSRGGEHKVVALWRYDKRDYYGSPELRVKVRVRDGVRMRVQNQGPNSNPNQVARWCSICVCAVALGLGSPNLTRSG